MGKFITLIKDYEMFDKPITKEELFEWMKNKIPIDQAGEYPDDSGNYERYLIYEVDDKGTTRLFKVEFCDDCPYSRWEEGKGFTDDYRPNEVVKRVEMVEQITYDYKNC